jgi:serine/threonine protein kinase
VGADAAAEEQFGPYLVYERLGVGGMATVHRALERGIEGFERVVALKRLLPHLAADASFIRSFVREAKLASLLNHVNIAQIFELGRVGTEYFISMEYVDGRDIRRILRHARKVSGPPPIHVTVGLLLQLCEALDYAHHRVDDEGAPLGLVHRDVSPSNVLVTSAGQVKVIDFGIAKAQSVQLRTQTGRVKGKLAYMAPEALAGKDLDARSDLFAAGVIAHELLTARPLFATKNEYQTLMKVQRGEIMPPSTFNQACPPELDAVVLRALARDPDDRFHHASDVRDELHAIRRQYNLQATDRDIAMWLEWAFSLEAPGGSFTATHTFDPSSSAADALSVHGKPKAKRTEDEESIDLAWGGGDEHNNGAPVVLDDVPDVSDKHLASASALGAEVRLDFDDLADDIPSSQPSHGVRPASASSRAATVAALLARPTHRPRPPTPAAPLRGQGVPAPASREPSEATRAPVATPAMRSGAMPPRVRTITIPPLGSAGAGAPGTRPSLSPPPPPGAAASLGTPVPTLARTSGLMPRLHSPTMPPAPHADGLMPAHADNLTTERTPALAPDTIPAMPALQHEPIVRFRAPSTPPPDGRTTAATAIPSAPSSGVPARAPSPPPPSGPATLPGPTGPMVRPARDAGTAAPPAPSLTPPLGQPRPRLITPATALFAEPDPDGDDDVAQTIVAPGLPEFDPAGRRRSAILAAQPAPGTGLGVADNLDGRAAGKPVGGPGTIAPGNASDSAIGAPPRTRRVLAVVAASVVVGVAIAGVTLYLTRPQREVSSPVIPVAPAPAKAVGTVTFAILPTDAAITIEGQPVHTGSPWQVELSPGVHQIEIHRDGYKAWLTSADVVGGQTQAMHVALEALDPAVAANATLVIEPPRGYDVVLDGTPLGDGAVIRQPIQAGPHTLVLRKDGIEIWKTQLEARASVVYDLTPVLTQHAAPARSGSDADAPAAPPPVTPAPPTAPEAGGSAGDRLAPAPAGSNAPAPAVGPPGAAPTGGTASAPGGPGSSSIGEVTPVPTPPVSPPPGSQ